MKCAPCFAVGKWGQIPTSSSDYFLHQLGKLLLQGGQHVCSFHHTSMKAAVEPCPLMVMRHLLTPNLTPFALMPTLFISLNSSSSFLPFVLLMCLQLATVLLLSLLLAQQEKTQLCAGPLISEQRTHSLLLSKERPGTSSNKREGKNIQILVLASSVILVELEEVQKRLASISLS